MILEERLCKTVKFIIGIDTNYNYTVWNGVTMLYSPPIDTTRWWSDNPFKQTRCLRPGSCFSLTAHSKINTIRMALVLILIIVAQILARSYDVLRLYTKCTCNNRGLLRTFLREITWPRRHGKQGKLNKPIRVLQGAKVTPWAVPRWRMR